MVTIRIQGGGSGDDFMTSYLGALAREIRDEVNEMRCPAHGQAPIIAIGGAGPLQVEYGVEACCQEFREVVERKLEEID